MKFLIINTDYLEFLHWLYAQHPALARQPYAEQMRIRRASFFGIGLWSGSLEKAGHEAYDLLANNESLQKMWAQEHDLHIPEFAWHFRLRKHILPWVSRKKNVNWLYPILAAQIRSYRPDVLLNQDMLGIAPEFLQELRPYLRLLVGQHPATPVPVNPGWAGYDLVISSFPPTVEWFRQHQVPAELHKLCFNETLLDEIKITAQDIDLSFVGSFFGIHESRTALLEKIAQTLPLKIWGPLPETPFAGSILEQRYMGYAWGKDMYRILGRSRITVNHHGDIPPYANNFRLFEATGMGTLLITDWKQNLPELFAPGIEVVTYRDAEECCEAIRYYLAHEQERQQIACAGQQRTLREHNSQQRIGELIEIIQRYL